MPIEARAVFCDDIRREDNGKAILIGVYTGDLIPGVLPANLPLSLWLDIRGMPLGHHKLTITVQLPDGEKISVPGEVEVNEADKPITLMFVGLPASIKEPGQITVTIEVAGNEIVAGQLIVTAPPSGQRMEPDA